MSEPELTKKQLQSLSGRERAGRQRNKLDNWIIASNKRGAAEGNTSATDQTIKDAVVSSKGGRKRPFGEEDDHVLVVEKKTLVECPICTMCVADTDINRHLDMLHP